MNDVQADKAHISYEVQRQFLRRTPVKLKQFSRLLSDMLVQEVDKLRVKALLSQVRKTREACLAQQFDSTARLLNQLSKQLAMNSESIKSQKTLLKRLASRLLDHAKQLELGVKPQRQSTPEATPEPEPLKNAEDSTDNEIEEFRTEAPVSFENYVEKGKLIFVEDPNQDQKLLQIRSDYTLLHQQFTSMGVDSLVVDSMENARTKAEEQQGSVIIANLDLVEEAEVLPDEEIEKNLTPVIYISPEDSQKNRAKSIRNGGQGFLVDPVSISTLCGQIEHLYDLNADSPKRILVMEDSKAQARYYEKVLSKGHFETRIVTDPSKLLETLREFEPESVLMDMQMPDSSGIELTQMIRQMPRYVHLPIIFLSAEENLRKQNQALKSGGTAFIVKPVQKDQLMFMADLYSERYRELSPQIEVNPDTELPYSLHFKQAIALEAIRMSRTSSSVALATLQLDGIEDLKSSSNFSFINRLLSQLSQLLKKRLRKTDLIGHLGQNRLGIILTSGRHPDWIETIQKVQEEFSSFPFFLENEQKSMTVSVGLATVETNYDPHQWIERSYAALSEALEMGSNGFKWVKT